MLTPLEQELLTYVEELTRACEASTQQLKASESALIVLERKLTEQTRLVSRDMIYCVSVLADSQEALMSSWQAFTDGGENARTAEKISDVQIDQLQDAQSLLRKAYRWINGEK
jgi:hypothetical protein